MSHGNNKKHSKYIYLAAEESLEGTTKSPTGAVLRSGNRIIKGSSCWERQVFGGKLFCLSGHGEMMALLQERHSRRLLPSLLAHYGLPALGNRHAKVQV